MYRSTFIILINSTLNALTSVNVFLNLVKNYLVTLNALTLVNVIH